MADVTWTEEQLAAITARNPGVLVSAGAGSGKTAVLTERVVQRIFDPADPVDADPDAHRHLYPGGSGGDAGAHRRQAAGRCSGNTPRTARWPGS